ncbi:Cu(+)/Ag(+) sensor histidine kinase [Pantoea cypripedii]|uniref:Sensor protein n=1 Tax=Pantoea cypripedii TaxID=55209 RepID=A0A1X1EJT0_PANCY|nr:Cu(+)/Ag(+) sensor histidine kinase [Pantoea cypripedii]MBP2200488.1 two-component system heavy metal sensor histidine kinase CusS [Pantoea cypripedii]ORM89191.1 two-component sensor histidine kinase [Pantoea cypripedii]
MKIKRLRRPVSLEIRLTFFISLATIIAFATAAWIMLHSVQNHFAEQDVTNLKQINSTLTAILKNPAETEQQKVAKIDSILDSYRYISVMLLSPENQVLYRSADGPDLMSLVHSTAVDSGEVFLWSDPMGAHAAHNGNRSYRVMATAVSSPYNGHTSTDRLLIALSIDFHLHYLDALKHNLLIIASAISLLIILIVLFAVHQGYLPLRNVSQQINNITSKNLDVRLEPDNVPIELQQLVMSFNHMIERIEDVFTRQANFSADIAHEIRTPITNLVTQTEIALSQPRTVKELEDVLYSSLEEYNRMAKMVSDMLFLAQADNNQLIPERVPLDLRTETIKVFEFFEAWAEEQQVGLTLTGDAALVQGDPLMLRRVINNLLSNAIRHTPAGKSVTVHLQQRDAWVELRVENPGVPISPTHLARLFDRFYRVDPSRQRKGEGSGIGLAIVKSIVTAHQGEIHVASDAVSTRFTLLLPRIEG